MRMISRFGRKTKQALACAALMAPAVAAWAQGVPIEDDDLADVWGQAMFSVDNRDADIANGILFDFTRITLNADVKLNANLTNILAGDAGAPSINIGDLRFVSSSNGSGGTNPYVQLKDPYLEFVYKNQGSTTDREIVGLRFGFGEMTGNLGTLFNTLRGNVTIQNGIETTAADPSTAGAGTLSLSSADGKASTFHCTGTASGCSGGSIGMNMVGQVAASGSTDFFVSILTQAVSNFGDGTSASAPDGIAINWTKNLTYQNVTGAVLANPLPALSVRQGG